MQDGLMNDDLHGGTSFQRMISGFCSSIPQPTPDCERKTRRKADFRDAIGYKVDILGSRLKDARFSLPEAVNLLADLKIKLS